MELLQWLNENDAGPIIKTVGAFGCLFYYFWLRFFSRGSRQPGTASIGKYGRRNEDSATTDSHHLVAGYSMRRQDYQMSQKETTLHLIDIRERLARIERQMGMYPPRRGVEPPTPEPVSEPAGEESSESGSTGQ